MKIKEGQKDFSNWGQPEEQSQRLSVRRNPPYLLKGFSKICELVRKTMLHSLWTFGLQWQPQICGSAFFLKRITLCQNAATVSHPHNLRVGCISTVTKSIGESQQSTRYYSSQSILQLIQHPRVQLYKCDSFFKFHIFQHNKKLFYFYYFQNIFQNYFFEVIASIQLPKINCEMPCYGYDRRSGKQNLGPYLEDVENQQ